MSSYYYINVILFYICLIVSSICLLIRKKVNQINESKSEEVSEDFSGII